MRKSTQDALAQLEVWFASYKRVKWIGGIYDSFLDAYCTPWAPVDSSDAPEIERLRSKISDWYGKAHDKWEVSEGVAFELKKRFRCNKTFMARFKEISRYIAKIELALPDDWVFPED